MLFNAMLNSKQQQEAPQTKGMQKNVYDYLDELKKITQLPKQGAN